MEAFDNFFNIWPIFFLAWILLITTNKNVWDAIRKLENNRKRWAYLNLPWLKRWRAVQCARIHVNRLWQSPKGIFLLLMFKNFKIVYKNTIFLCMLVARLLFSFFLLHQTLQDAIWIILEWIIKSGKDITVRRGDEPIDKVFHLSFRHAQLKPLFQVLNRRFPRVKTR